MNEEDKKVMRILIQIQSDDLNDSEMLANYADKMKGAGY